ncbi:MAG: PfkB family carbohydrate kinase [Flavobacteriales bacterium]
MAVVCAGELLFDCWPDGRRRPGGAPANLAAHAAALGAESVLLSRVGDDAAGRQLARWLTAARVGCVIGPADPDRPTGRVDVTAAPDGRPVYDIVTPAAWDFLEAAEAARQAAGRAKVFVYGTLAQRHPVGRRAIRSLAEAARSGRARVMADLNLRAPFYDDEILLWTLRHCEILKLNREELAEVSRLMGAAGPEAHLFTGLLREFGIARGVLTAGGDGAWIFDEGALTHEPAVPGTEVVDPVGAGDAFCAALAVGLAAGRSLRESAPRAARAAAMVVSRHGATPLLSPGI